MKLINMKQLQRLLGDRGRTTIYRDIELGRLPKPQKFGGRNYWSEEQIDELLMGKSARELGSAGGENA